MTNLIAYKNDPVLKESFLREVENHRKQDMILQGTYGREEDGWKGCAVACSLRSLAVLEGDKLKTDYSDHTLYETKLGLPEWLARLEDTLFEGLPKADAKKWPEQFAKAIPVGANLEPVKWQFGEYLMKENINRVMKLDISDGLKSQVIDALQKVMSVHQEAIRTGEWDKSAARSAALSAWSAESAAWSAARSVARSAAWSAALSVAWSSWSSESAALSAALSVAESARSAAWSSWSSESVAKSAESAESAAAGYTKLSKKLLTLLKAAKSLTLD